MQIGARPREPRHVAPDAASRGSAREHAAAARGRAGAGGGARLLCVRVGGAAAPGRFPAGPAGRLPLIALAVCVWHVQGGQCIA